MPKQKNDDLLALILSLSKAEKRHFRLFVSRNAAAEELLEQAAKAKKPKKG